MKLPEFLTSSSDGKSLSLRWKALASATIPTVALLLQLFGFAVPVESLNELANEIDKGILLVWEFVSVVAFIMGFARNLQFKKNNLGKYAKSE